MDVPILGQHRPSYSHSPAEDQDAVTRAFQLYDHELEAAFKVLARLRERSAMRRDLEAFNREIHQRFEEVGLVVKVKWFETDAEGTYAPEIDIIGRTHHEEFDHDRQVHEVTSDLLGTGDAGVIRTPPGMLKEQKEQHGHKH